MSEICPISHLSKHFSSRCRNQSSTMVACQKHVNLSRMWAETKPPQPEVYSHITSSSGSPSTIGQKKSHHRWPPWCQPTYGQFHLDWGKKKNLLVVIWCDVINPNTTNHRSLPPQVHTDPLKSVPAASHPHQVGFNVWLVGKTVEKEQCGFIRGDFSYSCNLRKFAKVFHFIYV